MRPVLGHWLEHRIFKKRKIGENKKSNPIYQKKASPSEQVEYMQTMGEEDGEQEG